MKNYLLFRKFILIVLLSVTVGKTYSGCGPVAKGYIIHNGLTTFAGVVPFPQPIYLTINPGDSIELKIAGDLGNCGYNFSGNWTYNNMPLLNTGGITLITLGQQGTYVAPCTAFPCYAGPFYVTFNAVGLNNINYLSFINLSPIPAKNNLTISFSSIKENDYTLTFANALGDIVKEYTLYHVLGEIKQEEDITALADGVYFLSIHNKDMIETRRFLKIKE